MMSQPIACLCLIAALTLGVGIARPRSRAVLGFAPNLGAMILILALAS